MSDWSSMAFWTEYEEKKNDIKYKYLTKKLS